MKYFDICTKREYEHNGESKVAWLKCGTLRETDNGKKFIEMNHLPTQSFYCFDQKPKEAAGSGQAQQETPAGVNWDE